jgi:hypothetical protein
VSGGFGKNPPPGTAIVEAGEVRKGDWFFIAVLGAWALCPDCAFGEDIKKSGHIVVRFVDPRLSPLAHDEKHWRRN